MKLPEGWQEKVDALKKKIIQETDPKKRNDLIDSHDTYWKEIKHLLDEISHGKCWYTEAFQCGTDVDMDHYRPKKEVFERKDTHLGYWWLAFDLSNYRYSCIVANRRRKRYIY